MKKAIFEKILKQHKAPEHATKKEIDFLLQELVHLTKIFLQPNIEALLDYDDIPSDVEKKLLQLPHISQFIQSQTRSSALSDTGAILNLDLTPSIKPPLDSLLKEVIPDTVLLLAAIKKGDLERVKDLLKPGIDLEVTSDYYSLLRVAVNEGQYEIAKLLILAGANVNAKAGSGSTPLLAACMNGNMEMVRLLIEHGADVNQMSNHNESPLWYAALHGYSEIVSLLIAKGANLEAVCQGCTPLLCAANKGHDDIVNMLAANGANVHVTRVPLQEVDYFFGTRFHSCVGDTALMLAANHPEVVLTLIAYGVDVNASNEKCETALFKAIENENEETILLLLKFGADVEACRTLERYQTAETPLQVVSEAISRNSSIVPYSSKNREELEQSKIKLFRIAKNLIEFGASLEGLERTSHLPELRSYESAARFKGYLQHQRSTMFYPKRSTTEIEPPAARF